MSTERQQSRARLDQCLGCHWGDPDEVRPATVSALMSCAHVSSTGARLRNLCNRGLITGSYVDGEWPRQLYYVPSNTPEAKEYVDALPKGPCASEAIRSGGLQSDSLSKVFDFETTSAAAEIAGANTAAEAFLIENSNIKHATTMRRRMLGCVACKLFRRTDAVVTGRHISRCTGASIDATITLLETAKDAGLLTTSGPVNAAGRRIYQSADTELGQAFTDLLTPPVACIFDTARQLHEQAKQGVAPSFNETSAYPQLPESPA